MACFIVKPDIQGLQVAFEPHRVPNSIAQSSSICQHQYFCQILTTEFSGAIDANGKIMTAQVLSSELSNLIQESKRKHSELRNVSEAVAYC